MDIEQAETEIKYACDNVKYTFKMQEALDKQDTKMLSDIQMVCERMKTTSDAKSENQMPILDSLDSLRSCQAKLADKGDAYEYVRLTDSIKRDAVKHAAQELERIKGNSQIVTTSGSGEQGGKGRVVITRNEELEKVRKVQEVSRIRIEKGIFGKDNAITGMEVYQQHVFAVHQNSFIVYCYRPDGSLGDVYRHRGGEDSFVTGMSLMMDGKMPMLVISDETNQSLIWIVISGEFTMKHHRTQQVGYKPGGSCNNASDIMVCDLDNNKIHRYMNDGQADEVITLPDDVIPWRLTRQGDREDYVILDYFNDQVVIIDKHGEIKTRYKDEIHSVKLGEPYDVISDQHGGILIADTEKLLLLRDGDEVKQLLQKQNIMRPVTISLDKDYNRLYVFGAYHTDEVNEGHGNDDSADKDDVEWCVVVYDYRPLALDKTFTEKNPS